MRRQFVLIVPGFLGSPLEFLPLKIRLAGAGFKPLTWWHLTVNRGIEGHTTDFLRWVERLGINPHTDTVHFVGHSMGAIIIRRALGVLFSERAPLSAGRAVLITPPNKGSYVARAVPRPLQAVIPVIGELSDLPGSYVNRLPEMIPVETGIILARGDHLVAPDAGIIPVSGGAVTVNGWHSGVLYDRKVFQLVDSFLRHGAFPPREPRVSSLHEAAALDEKMDGCGASEK